MVCTVERLLIVASETRFWMPFSWMLSPITFITIHDLKWLEVHSLDSWILLKEEYKERRRDDKDESVVMLYIDPCLSANNDAKNDRITCLVNDSVQFAFYMKFTRIMNTSIHKHPSWTREYTESAFWQREAFFSCLFVIFYFRILQSSQFTTKTEGVILPGNKCQLFTSRL